MQIQLKQPEIIAAIKQYIAKEGISMSGKTVDMVFTAGRKESGLSVEVTIEEVNLPDMGYDAEVKAPALALVSAPPVAKEVPADAGTDEAGEAAPDRPAPAFKTLFSAT